MSTGEPNYEAIDDENVDLNNNLTKSSIKLVHQAAVLPLTTREIKPKTVDYCRHLVLKYCRIIQHEVGDFLPKHCYYFLYEKSVELMKSEIVRNLLFMCIGSTKLHCQLCLIIYVCISCLEKASCWKT